jgi:hypothetical protein
LNDALHNAELLRVYFMTKTDQSGYARRPWHALAKVVVIVAAIALAGYFLAEKLDDPAISRLKFNLSLASLIGIVVVINLASLSCIALLYAAYRWVRRDLKAPRSEDILSID